MGPTRRLGATAAVLVVGWTVVSLAFAHSAFPRTPLSFGLKRGWAYAVAPEWWAFFTRDPTEGQPLAFRLTSNGNWVSAMSVPNGSAANLAGWRRKGRGQGADLDQILKRVPREAWRSCVNVRPVGCLPHRGRAGDVILDIDNPLLCGFVGIVRARPVPFELSTRDDVEPSNEWVVVRVLCPRA